MNKHKIIFTSLVLLFHAAILIKEVKKIEYKKVASTQKKRVRVKLAPKPKVKKAQQIVQTEEKAPSKKPVKTKYLSKNNQKFDRETVAKRTGTFKEAGYGNSKSETKQVNHCQSKRLKQMSLTWNIEGIP